MRLRISLPLLLAMLCLGANPIWAQTSAASPETGEEGSESIADPDTKASAYQSPEPAGTFARPVYKSAGTAIGLSVLGTAVPFLAGTQLSGDGKLAAGLVIGGLVVGPSLGQFYAGSPGGGVLGVGIRTGGALMTLLGFAYLLSDVLCMETEEHGCGEKEDAGAPLLIVGTATYLGGAIYSLVDASLAVERYNTRQDNERVFGWSPTIAPGPQGGLRTGAMAWMRF